MRCPGSFEFLLDIVARLAEPNRLPLHRRDPIERDEMVPASRCAFLREFDA